MKCKKLKEAIGIAFRGRFLVPLLSCSLIILCCSCGRMKRVFADCDHASRLRDVAIAIASAGDIDPAFTSVGMKRPEAIRTAPAAQEYLLRAAADIGCEDKVHSWYLLGKLYLRQKRYHEAARVLTSSVDADPTADGFQALAEAYAELGDTARAKKSLSGAKSLNVK